MQARSFRLRFHRVIHMSNTVDICTLLGKVKTLIRCSVKRKTLLCFHCYAHIPSTLPSHPCHSPRAHPKKESLPRPSQLLRHTQTAAPFHVPYFPFPSHRAFHCPTHFPCSFVQLVRAPSYTSPSSKPRGFFAEARPNIGRRKNMLETHLFSPIISFLASNDHIP